MYAESALAVTWFRRGRPIFRQVMRLVETHPHCSEWGWEPTASAGDPGAALDADETVGVLNAAHVFPFGGCARREEVVELASAVVDTAGRGVQF